MQPQFCSVSEVFRLGAEIKHMGIILFKNLLSLTDLFRQQVLVALVASKPLVNFSFTTTFHSQILSWIWRLKVLNLLVEWQAQSKCKVKTLQVRFGICTPTAQRCVLPVFFPVDLLLWQ